MPLAVSGRRSRLSLVSWKAGLAKVIKMTDGRQRRCSCHDFFVGSTLLTSENRVVCPLALIGQWEDEIIKMTEDVTVIKHHGPTRTAGELKGSRILSAH